MSVVTLASKDLRVLCRDKWGLFWVTAFPLMIALFFGAIFSGAGSGPSGTMRIAVVDEDDSDMSRAYIQKLEGSKALDVVQLGRDEAQEEVRKGKLVAYAVLEKGFGETSGLFFGEAPPLELGIDPSRKAESSYLRGLLVQKSFEVLQEKFSDPQTLKEHMQDLTKDIDTSADLSPVQQEVLKRFMGDLDQFLADIDPELYQGGPQWEGANIETVSVSVSKTGPRSSFEITFPQAILWGLLGCSAAFAISIVTERVGGTYLRLRLAPISRSQILAGKGLACFVAVPLPITGAWTGAVAAFLFQFRIRDAFLAICLGVMVAGIIVTLTCLGMLHFFPLVIIRY